MLQVYKNIMNIKTKIIRTVVILYGLFLDSSFTFAASSQDKLDSPIAARSLQEFFAGIVDVLIQLGVVVSALGIMYGGFLLVTAQGDEEKVSNGRKTITWAVVGTAVLLGAKVIFVAIKGTVDQLQ